MSFVKILFNPIFLLAVGMHAGLLLIPIAGGSSEDVVPAPNPEGESITVTRIPPRQTKPDKSAAGPATPKPNRSVTPTAATTARTAAGGQPGAVGANPQQRSQGNTRRGFQGAQSSGGRSSANGRSNGDGHSNTNGQGPGGNHQSSQTALNNPNESSGLPSLPDGDDQGATTVPVTTVPPEQTAPNLTALRNGAQPQAVPNLLQAFLARLRHSVLRTTEPEVEEAKRLWLDDLGQQSGLQGASPETLDQSLKLSYPLTTVEADGPRQIRSCLNPLPVKGLVGVIVEANGEIVTEPTLLRSSGYGFLNDIALEKIKHYDNFPEESAQKIYMVDVEVDYDKTTCVDLAKLKTN